jgi:mono/diheme cytochrome c family protein
MKFKPMIILFLLAAAMTGAVFALPQPGKAGGSNSRPATSANENDLRLEGEQRFRTNCGRCHMAPHKFPSRMMATIIRHMRVRATLTDADMRIILRYMTQ